MKRIVIPTDFTIGSLQLVGEVAAHFPGSRLHITLLHGMEMPTGILDLLFLGKRNEHNEMVTPAFANACQIIENKYASVLEQLTVQFVYGNNRRVVQHFLDANDIGLVVLPSDGLKPMADPQSVDLAALLKKCRVPVLELPVKTAAAKEKVLLADLLLAG
ncbi:hypothetical protein [Deminuibacter soli]|uniref:Universal stress protein n=1 Tax=Deminuibacter soli TaxID=2291815 RepID=A0A3E1NEB9_9BACT|nr:hypothetical protein [Deminuibacter soli]RFM26118.1 hypothetical protein DXN05_21155 [Deminuibacter soli]